VLAMIQADADLEAYLTRLERPFERLNDGTYLIGAGDGRLVALKLAPPVLVLRAEIGDAPKDAASSLGLFRKLLELNATALLHAAYGLESERIVLAAALELASADLGELEAVLADVDLALAEHVPVLQELRQVH
jgi:hypothetical protein